MVLFRLTGVVLSLNLFAEAFPLKLSAPRGLWFPLRGVSSTKRCVQCPCSQLRPELPQRLPGRLAQLKAQMVAGVSSVCHRILGCVASRLSLLAGPVFSCP